MQNSQRVLLALPRTAVASATRGGAMGTSRPTATGHNYGARAARGRDAKPRTAVAIRHARRRDGDIAPYRNGARAVRAATGHNYGARAVRTATGHGRGTREMGGAGGAQGHCVRIG